jgi:hypothetical protein
MMLVIVSSMIATGALWPWLGLALIVRELLTVCIGLFALAPLERRGVDAGTVHWTGKVGFAATAAGLIVLLSTPPVPGWIAGGAGLVLCGTGFTFGVVAVLHYAAFARRAWSAQL